MNNQNQTKSIIFNSRQILISLLFLLAVSFFVACSNSDFIGVNDNSETIVSLESSESTNSATSEIIDYLPLDDSEYPYANIPRIVIETENRRAIKDCENEIPAKLQIWGRKSPKSDIMALTIRGRGNTSWDMPKKSYKIELTNKQPLLGMPKDRDWALIANYADKTLIKNYLMYHLSSNLGAYYAPRCEFAELFLNGEYLGIYLLTETVKIAKDRINIPENRSSYIVEFDSHIRNDEQAIYSNIIQKNTGKIFRIHTPKNISETELSAIKNLIYSFETFLINTKDGEYKNIARWIDIDEFIRHYWVQEFSKNPDSWYSTSVFFSWVDGHAIKMGPVWDFDLAFGGHTNELPYEEYAAAKRLPPNGWYTNIFYWNKYLFSDSTISKATKTYWTVHKNFFFNLPSTIDSIVSQLHPATNNNFRKWNILQSTKSYYHTKAFNSYEDAIKDLKNWICDRLLWIDSNIN